MQNTASAYGIPPLMTFAPEAPQMTHGAIRTVPAGRVKRLRVSWFTLGLLAGCALTSQLGRISLPDTGAMISELRRPSVQIDAAPAQHSENAVQPLVLAAPLPKPLAAAEPAPEAPAAGDTAMNTDAVATAPVAQDEAMPQIAYPLNLEFSVARGDTLTDVITQHRVPGEDAAAIVAAVKKVYNPKDLSPGRDVSMELDQDPDEDFPYVRSMKIEANHMDTVVVKYTKTGYVAQKIGAPVHREVAHAGGQIRGSFYGSAASAGLPENLMSGVVKAFSYDVDFARDLHRGDRFDALFESFQTPDGHIVKTGKLLYASLKVGGKPIELYAYTDKNGETLFYNAKGESTRKALLKTPISGAQVTSGFGMRFHPILGYNKMHKGLDFGAPTGTPIFAAGDGTIERASNYMGYGNYVRIDHNATYSTAYGHMSRFAKNIRPGVKVKQGQVIGYVGTTGRSTGPHLHYEVLIQNAQVNPAKMTVKTGNMLAGADLKKFQHFRDSVKMQLAQAASKKGKQQLAMNDVEVKTKAN